MGSSSSDRAGQVHRLVPAALLLPDERQQPAVPPVVAVPGAGPLDDVPGLLGYRGDPGESDRGYGDREQQCVARVRLEVVDQRTGVAGDVRDDGVDVAAFPLRCAPRVQPSGGQPALDVDGGAVLVAEQGEPGMAEGERRVVRDRLGDAEQAALLYAEQGADALVVGGGRGCGRGQRQAVQVIGCRHPPVLPGRRSHESLLISLDLNSATRRKSSSGASDHAAADLSRPSRRTVLVATGTRPPSM